MNHIEHELQVVSTKSAQYHRKLNKAEAEAEAELLGKIGARPGSSLRRRTTYISLLATRPECFTLCKVSGVPG